MPGHRARFALLLLALAACAGPRTEYVPAQLDDGWTVGTLAAARLDADSIAAITRAIEDGEYPNTHALLVEHDGKLVYEAYFAGTDERWGDSLGGRVMGRDSLHDLRSITKSVTSLVLGIALGDGADSMLGRPLASFFPDREVSADVEQITLHHALTMTAGLEWNEMTVPYTSEENDEIRLYATTDPIGYVLSRPLVHPPGERWNYNGGLSQVIAGVVRQLTGMPVDAYAREVLFDPLGITEYEWLGEPEWEPAMPSAASGLRLRARDLAKIGSLVLHGGMWNGMRVVPESWIAVSGRRHVREIGEWSNDGMWGYGYQWWVGAQRDGHVVIAGVGNGNQRLFVLPADRLVVTVFAGEYNRFEGHSARLFERIHHARHSIEAARR
jgi:CubicO group peptidase (beta-lactamase class C family)